MWFRSRTAKPRKSAPPRSVDWRRRLGNVGACTKEWRLFIKSDGSEPIGTNYLFGQWGMSPQLVLRTERGTYSPRKRRIGIIPNVRMRLSIREIATWPLLPSGARTIQRLQTTYTPNLKTNGNHLQHVTGSVGEMRSTLWFAGLHYCPRGGRHQCWSVCVIRRLAILLAEPYRPSALEEHLSVACATRMGYLV